MLINAIFFITLIPFEFVIMKWLVKKLILEFKNMEDKIAYQIIHAFKNGKINSEQILKDKLNDLPPFYQNVYQSESEKKPGW